MKRPPNHLNRLYGRTGVANIDPAAWMYGMNGTAGSPATGSDRHQLEDYKRTARQVSGPLTTMSGLIMVGFDRRTSEHSVARTA